MTDLITAFSVRPRNREMQRENDDNEAKARPAKQSTPAASGPQAVDAHADPADDKRLLRAAVGWVAHGFLFVLLICAALIRFGQVFDVLATIVGIICAFSFRTAWQRLREYRAGAHRRAAIAATSRR
jgi:hypothetical protein